MRIGLQVDSTSNNHFMYMQAALMQEGDVVVGISHSGYSKEVIQALNIAKRIAQPLSRLRIICVHPLRTLRIMS